jgi:hypothetical protein
MARKKKKAKTKKRKPSRKTTRPSKTKKNRRAERDLEEGLRETFPGSDALAVTDPTRSIKE